MAVENPWSRFIKNNDLPRRRINAYPSRRSWFDLDRVVQSHLTIRWSRAGHTLRSPPSGSAVLGAWIVCRSRRFSAVWSNITLGRSGASLSSWRNGSLQRLAHQHRCVAPHLASMISVAVFVGNDIEAQPLAQLPECVRRTGVDGIPIRVLLQLVS